MSVELAIQQAGTVAPAYAEFGRYNKRSLACAIYGHDRHIEVNLMRAQKHMSYKDIATELRTTVKNVKRHFEQHFIVSEASQKLIDLKESSNDAATEIVRQILEEDLDLFSATKGVLKSKAEGIVAINARIDHLQDEFDKELVSEAEDFTENNEQFIKLLKIKKDMENDILKAYNILDDKLFPDANDLQKSMLQFRLDNLKKLIDRIQAVLLMVSDVSATHAMVVCEIRVELAKHINLLEMEIASHSHDVKTHTISDAEVLPENF